ncbi:hypothetical protein [Vibrio coralliirubri]|uniref:hypothetical protein n=1 Tax=Vibrio coralliirubri TaxID=1516159 RepID=UPI000630CB0B|nr:hypothetical protein [Vibrio coralliirubri]CDU08788.1 hypothetical protein VCR8J2_50002 [Vibrio coralliirubri]
MKKLPTDTKKDDRDRQAQRLSEYFEIQRASSYDLLAKFNGYDHHAHQCSARRKGNNKLTQELQLLSSNSSEREQFLLSRIGKLVDICQKNHCCLYKTKNEIAEFLLRRVFRVNILFPQEVHKSRTPKFKALKLPFVHQTARFTMNSLTYKVVAIPIIRITNGRVKYKFNSTTHRVQVLNEWLSQVGDVETSKVNGHDSVVYGWPVAESQYQGQVTCAAMLGDSEPSIEYSTIQRRHCDYSEVIEFKEFKLLLTIAKREEYAHVIPPYLEPSLSHHQKFVLVQPMPKNIGIYQQAIGKSKESKPKGHLLGITGNSKSLKWLINTIFESLKKRKLIHSLCLNQVCTDVGYEIAKGLRGTKFVMYYPSISLDEGYRSSTFHSLIATSESSLSECNKSINGLITISESAVRLLASLGEKKALSFVDKRPARFLHEYDETKFLRYNILQHAFKSSN